MTNSDIAHVAVMSRGLVAKLSKLRNWSQVNISIATRFSMACGVDLLAPSEQIRFLRKRALKYQKTGSPMQKKMFRRIANELVKPERQ